MSSSIVDRLRTARIRDLSLGKAPMVAPDTALADVFRLLDEGKCRAVVIVDAGRLLGIFTERDILYRLGEEWTPEMPVSSVMVVDPKCLTMEATLGEAVRLMVDGGYRHVPLVNDSGAVLGLLTGRHIFAYLADHFPSGLINLPPRLHQTLRRPEGG